MRWTMGDPAWGVPRASLGWYSIGSLRAKTVIWPYLLGLHDLNSNPESNFPRYKPPFLVVSSSWSGPGAPKFWPFLSFWPLLAVGLIVGRNHDSGVSQAA